MTKKLLVVFASGLVLSILLLSMAWAIGGTAITNQITDGKGWHFTIDDDDDGDNAHMVMASRTLAFNQAQPLEIEAPVKLTYRKGDQPSLTVKGPQKLVEAVRWENGRLSMRDVPLFSHHALTVELVAPAMPSLVFKGAGSVDLQHVDQPALQIAMQGAGNVEASGKVQTLMLTSSGAGNMDLEDLLVHDATVKASGVGNVDLSADGKVDVEASGAGNISLHRKPAELNTRTSGIGSINQDY